MPEFSTNESVSLERNVELKSKTTEFLNKEQLEKAFETDKCVAWVKDNGFEKLCLQFPDHLLPHSSEVALKLQKLLEQTVYILGDTAYESCCIDYVAAAHINADAIIHFGPICFSKMTDKIPFLNIYEKQSLVVDDLQVAVSNFLNEVMKDQSVVLFLDDGFIHLCLEICNLWLGESRVKVCKIDENLSELCDQNIVYIGSNERKLMNINLSLKSKSLYYFNPNNHPAEVKQYQPDSKLIKKRYFLIEKIRDAHTIGIVIGTLAVQNYLRVIERIKKLAEVCGKKYYLISVGKPTVAKLANIGEIDIYVMITCALNEIFDSRDFYKPVVTPYDVEMALNSDITEIEFTYDYNDYLNRLDDISYIKRNANETDISLITGKLRTNKGAVMDDSEEADDTQRNTSVALKNEGTVALNTNFGAGYLSQRSWKGLEQNLGQNDVKLAEEGRKGIAQGYENEKA